MYTLEQLRKIDKPSVLLEKKEEWEHLKKLGFRMTQSYYGPHYYQIKEGLYCSDSGPRKPYGINDGYTSIHYSEIDFEEQFIPQIFN